MGTHMPCSLQAALNSRTMRSRSAGVASMGTRSLSCRLTPQAPSSPRMATISFGGMVGRTASPKGSRPRLPRVQRPKENLCSGRGLYLSFDMVPPTELRFKRLRMNWRCRGWRATPDTRGVLLLHDFCVRRIGLDLFGHADGTLAGLVDARPHPGPDAGQQRSAIGCAFLGFDHLNRVTVDIGLNLLPELGARAAAAESDAADGHVHLVEDREGIAQAEGDAFHDGAYNMSTTVAGRQSHERGACLGVEVWRTLAHEVRSPQNPVRSRRNVPGFIRQALVGVAVVLRRRAEIVAKPA